MRCSGLGDGTPALVEILQTLVAPDERGDSREIVRWAIALGWTSTEVQALRCVADSLKVSPYASRRLTC